MQSVSHAGPTKKKIVQEMCDADHTKFLLQHPLHCRAETLESLAANGGTYRKNSDVVELALPHDPQQGVILWPDGN